MKYGIYSAHELKSKADVIFRPHIVIRLGTNTLDYQTELLPNDYRYGELRLTCNDVEKEDQYLAFTQEQACEVKEFVTKWETWVELIIAQCTAGISRSSAVIMALAQYYDHTPDIVLKNYAYDPNTLIYRRLCDVFELTSVL